MARSNKQQSKPAAKAAAPQTPPAANPTSQPMGLDPTAPVADPSTDDETSEPMGLDPTPPPATAEPKAEPPADTAKPPRQPAQQIICPYCKGECKAGKTEAFFTRYYCPDPLCNYSQKVPRPKAPQPQPEPLNFDARA